jgi:uncharacterized protein
MGVFISESDRVGHKPAYLALLELFRERSRAGATVTKGVAGFGANSIIHTTRILDVSSDLPLVVEVVDTQEHIDRVLPEVGGMMGGGLITMEKVKVVRYCEARK